MGAKSLLWASPRWATRLCGRSMQDIARTPLVKIYNTFVHVYMLHYYFLERYVGNKNTTETITILRIIRFWVCISNCQLFCALRRPQSGQGFLLAKSAWSRCSLKYPTQTENHFWSWTQNHENFYRFVITWTYANDCPRVAFTIFQPPLFIIL